MTEQKDFEHSQNQGTLYMVFYSNPGSGIASNDTKMHRMTPKLL